MQGLVVWSVRLAAGVAAVASVLSLPGGCESQPKAAAEKTAGREHEAATAGGAGEAERMGPWGFDVSGMDRSVKPGDDFFAYASGTWAKNVVIKPDRPAEGAFFHLREVSEARCHEILEGLKGETDGDRGKLAALYASFMNESEAERRDSAPVQPLLGEIKGVQTRGEFGALMGRGTKTFGVAAFHAAVGDDRKDPDHYTLNIRQSGLGLGNREFYLRDSFKGHRERYQQYIAQMLEMASWSEPQTAAAGVMAFETDLARAHWSIAESREVEKTYNPMNGAELERLTPGFDWPAYFAGAGFENVNRVVVGQRSAFPVIAELLGKTDIGTLRAWAAFHVVDGAAPLLSRRFVDAHFAFRQKFLNQVPEQRERWKRGVEFVESCMGEALGREYVAKYFPASSKAEVETMVGNLKTALKARVERLDWMSSETKARAQEKLSKFGLKIGYPSKWRDYSALQARPDDLMGNAIRARKHNAAFWAARLGQRVDRADFGMTPETVNAYYSSTRNEIVFPAAILQPPFFDPAADPAVNYGGIGAVIGHEITHGFDDQGRKSDGEGMLTDWWTAADAAQFESRAGVLGASYEAINFPQFPGLHINGKQTMGENIADLGGLLLAYDAYERSLGGKPAAVIDGFTGEQRLFLGWAQVWRTAMRDEALRQRIINDVHSPGTARATVPPRNVDAWYAAFGVQPGDSSYIAPENRARIW